MSCILNPVLLLVSLSKENHMHESLRSTLKAAKTCAWWLDHWPDLIIALRIFLKKDWHSQAHLCNTSVKNSTRKAQSFRNIFVYLTFMLYYLAEFFFLFKHTHTNTQAHTQSRKKMTKATGFFFFLNIPSSWFDRHVFPALNSKKLLPPT